MRPIHGNRCMQQITNWAIATARAKKLPIKKSTYWMLTNSLRHKFLHSMGRSAHAMDADYERRLHWLRWDWFIVPSTHIGRDSRWLCVRMMWLCCVTSVQQEKKTRADNSTKPVEMETHNHSRLLTVHKYHCRFIVPLVSNFSGYTQTQLPPLLLSFHCVVSARHGTVTCRDESETERAAKNNKHTKQRRNVCSSHLAHNASSAPCLMAV